MTQIRQSQLEYDPNDIALRLERIEIQLNQLLEQHEILSKAFNEAIRTPPQMKPHWEYGHEVMLDKTVKSIQSTVGKWILTIILGAVGSAIVAWAILAPKR